MPLLYADDRLPAKATGSGLWPHSTFKPRPGTAGQHRDRKLRLPLYNALTNSDGRFQFLPLLLLFLKV